MKIIAYISIDILLNKMLEIQKEYFEHNQDEWDTANSLGVTILEKYKLPGFHKEDYRNLYFELKQCDKNTIKNIYNDLLKVKVLK